MGNHVFMKDMIDGMPIDCDYVLVSHTIKQTKAGKDFIDATLSDKGGQIACKKWDVIGEEALVDGGVVHIIGTVNPYNGAMQIRADEIIPREISDVDLEPLLPVAPRAGIDMFNELYDLASNFKNEDLRNVTCHILKQEKDKLLNMPGGKSMHHAMINGLLYHTVCMTEDAIALSKVYPEINAELLEAGTILHDIGKIWEFDTGPLGLIKDYSVEGNLEGHLYMGAAHIASICDLLHVSAETKLMLTHMILSHHGKPEYGAVKEPMFAEAFMLNMIDELDSHLEVYLRLEKEAEPGKMTERAAQALGKNLHVYHPTFR